MDVVLILHLAAVAIVALANIAALVTTVLARRTSAPGRILRLLRLHHVFAARTLVPAAVVTLLSGAWLTYRTGASLFAPWMLGTLVAFAASALAGILFLLPEEERAIREAERLVARGETTVSPTLVRHTAAPAIIAWEWGAQALMAVMFALMMWRPA